MAAIFGKRKIFLKIAKSTFLRYPMGWKFQRNNPILHGQGKFVFFHFGQKFENSKWPPFLGRGKFFENCLWVENFDEIALSRTVKEIESILCFAILGKNSKMHFWDNLWVENFDEIAVSRTVKEIEAILCFAIFGKNSKIQKMAAIFGEGEFFWNCQEYIAGIPCGSKISTKSLCLIRLRR